MAGRRSINLNMLNFAFSPKDSGVESLYEDGRQYDLHHAGFDEDVGFYVNLATRARNVLELACGTCRLGIPIARSGSSYTGIDISHRMLRWAREKADSVGLDINLIRGDIRVFHLHERFDLIVLAFNSLCHLYTGEDIESCFACVREHLTEGGLFAVDVFNPSLEILLRNPNERYPAGEYEDPAGRGRVVVTETNVYDRATQINWITWYYHYEKTGEEKQIRFGMRIYYPQELDALLSHCGFKIEAKYGDFDLSAFTSDSTKQVVVASSAS